VHVIVVCVCLDFFTSSDMNGKEGKSSDLLYEPPYPSTRTRHGAVILSYIFHAFGELNKQTFRIKKGAYVCGTHLCLCCVLIVCMCVSLCGCGCGACVCVWVVRVCGICVCV